MAQGQGITSLMPGQAPAPGQSAQPMPGMQPPMGGPSAGVVDLVGPLKNLPEQVLTMELMNPQSKLEKYAVLAALDQKNRERKTMQAVQGMMAQQQNAQMQGQGTVAQQVAQEAQAAEEPVMAALGGLMRSYAGGGGVVAFAGGDAVWRKRLLAAGVPESFIAEREARGAGAEQIESDAKSAGYMGAQTSPVAPQVNIPSAQQREVDRILKKAPTTRTPEENDLLKAAGVSLTSRAPAPEGSLIQRAEDFLKSPFIREAVTGGAHKLSPEELAQRTDVGAITERGFRALGGSQAKAPPARSPTTFIPVEDARRRGDIPPEGIVAALPSRDVSPPVVPASREGAAKTRTVMPPPVTAPAATAPVTTGIPAALQEQLDAQRAALKGQLQKPAELTKKEAGLDALMQQRIREEEGRSAEPAAEAMKALQEALRRREEFDPGDWFRLAGSIDPRRGYTFKSMGEGLAGIMERKAQAAEAARKELVAAQREQRQLQSKVSELRILAQQEQVLRENKEFDRANAVRDKMFGLEKDIFTLQRDIEEKNRKYLLEKEDTESRRISARAQQAAAGRPTETQERIALFKSNPQMYKDMYGDKSATDAAKLATIFSNDPRLKKLAETLALDPTNPDALAQYAAREKELTAKYAPEMLLGGAAPAAGKPATSSVRSAADAIVGAQ